MKSRLLGVVCASYFGLCTQHVNGALIATNIAGSDGSVSLINATDVPLVISNIQGLALTNSNSPGDNLVGMGRNNIPDLSIGDTYFQGSGSVGAGTPSTADQSFLFEATNGGTAGVDILTWSIDVFQNYDGSGVALPTTLSESTNTNTLSVNGIDVTLNGTIVTGDKFIVNNGGVSTWNVWADADIDGDGTSNRGLVVRAEDFGTTGTRLGFNFQTVAMIGWEIANGQFVSGQFDITIDEIAGLNTWPGGDLFDVIEAPVPVPPAVWLFGTGLIGLVGMARRKAA